MVKDPEGKLLNLMRKNLMMLENVLYIHPTGNHLKKEKQSLRKIAIECLPKRVYQNVVIYFCFNPSKIEKTWFV